MNKEKQSLCTLFKEHDVTKLIIEDQGVGGQTASIVCRNFWKTFSKEDKQNFIKCKATGDNKLGAIFICIGKVKYLEDIMSCYRHITEEGDSWSATTSKKNMQLYRYNSKIELKKMVYNIFRQHFNPPIENYLLSTLIIILKKPNKENLKIFCAILNKNDNKTKALINLVPQLMSKIAIRLKISSKKQKFSRPLLEKIDISDEVIHGK